jgi:hypothetical protein
MANGIWNVNSGNWSSTGSWSGGTIASAGGYADFGTRNYTITTPIVTVDAPFTIGDLYTADADIPGTVNLTFNGGFAITLDPVGAGQSLVTTDTPTIINAPVSGTNGFVHNSTSARRLTLSNVSNPLTGTIRISGAAAISLLGGFPNGVTVSLTSPANNTNLTLGANTLANSLLDVQCGDTGSTQFIIMSGTGPFRIKRMTGGAGKYISFQSGANQQVHVGTNDAGFDSDIYNAYTGVQSAGAPSIRKVGTNTITIGPTGTLRFGNIDAGNVIVQNTHPFNFGTTPPFDIENTNIANDATLTLDVTTTAVEPYWLEPDMNAGGLTGTNGPKIAVSAGVTAYTSGARIFTRRGTDKPATFQAPAGATLYSNLSYGLGANLICDVLFQGGGTFNCRFNQVGSPAGGAYVTVKGGSTYRDANAAGAGTVAGVALVFDIQENSTVALYPVGTASTTTPVYASVGTGSRLTFGHPTAPARSSNVYSLTGTASAAVEGRGTTIHTLNTAATPAFLPNSSSTTKIDFYGRIGKGSGPGDVNADNLSLDLDYGVSYINGSDNTYVGLTIVRVATLDGRGRIVNSTVLPRSDGSVLAAGRGVGAGDFQLKQVDLSVASPIFQGSRTTGQSSGYASKVIISSLVSQIAGRTIRARGAGSGWEVGKTYTIVQFSPARDVAPLVNATAYPWTDSANPRIGNGTVTSDKNGIYLAPQYLPAAEPLVWNGGVDGEWYNGATGFLLKTARTDVPFYSGDTVFFDATSTVIARVTEDISINNLTLDPVAQHTIRTPTAKKILAGGLLTVPAVSVGQAFDQRLELEGTWTGVTLSGPLVVSHANALQGASTGKLTFNQQGSLKCENVDMTVAFGPVWNNVGTSGAGNTSSYITKTGGKTLDLTGNVTSGGNIYSVLLIRGEGILKLSGTNTGYSQQMYLNDSSVPVGRNVLRITGTTNSSGLANGAFLAFNEGGIFETVATSFTRKVTSTGLESGLAAFFGVGPNGGGFSAIGTGTLSISTVVGFGPYNVATAPNNWNGPIYFGTGYSSSTQTTNLSSPTITIDPGVDQVFHVFAGANTAGSTAGILGVISSTGNCIARKRGAGVLALYGKNTYQGSTIGEAGRILCVTSRSVSLTDVTLNNGAELQATATGANVDPADTGYILHTKSMVLKAGSKVIIGA